MSPGASSSSVRPGDLLAGKYRVERVIGQGGMGVVVVAHHLQLDEKVAIKFLLPDALTNADTVARFGREARAAVKIKSEHVARVIDVGELENGSPYMVMEYLEGGDLEATLAASGPLLPYLTSSRLGPKLTALGFFYQGKKSDQPIVAAHEADTQPVRRCEPAHACGWVCELPKPGGQPGTEAWTITTVGEFARKCILPHMDTP